MRFTFGHLYSSGLDRELGTDDSTQLFTTARRKTAILEGEQQFVDLTECLQRELTISCSNGVREYDLLSSNTGSTDFMRLSPQGPEYAIVSSNSTAVGSTTHAAGSLFPRRDIPRLNRESPGWRQSTGARVPASWYLRTDGGRHYLGFSEPPTILSSETATLTVPYLAAPAQSTESTRLMFVVNGEERVDLRPYHDAVTHYAAHALEKLRKDQARSDLQLQRFSGYISRYLEQKRHRTGHQRVSVSRRYFAESRRGGRYRGDPRIDPD